MSIYIYARLTLSPKICTKLAVIVLPASVTRGYFKGQQQKQCYFNGETKKNNDNKNVVSIERTREIYNMEWTGELRSIYIICNMYVF